MRDDIIEWMQEHVTEYTNAMDLANGAIDTFHSSPSWIWDAAQEIFDLSVEKRVTNKYA